MIKMKFLCICEQGNVRSYALARILKHAQHEAINIGTQNFTADSIDHFAYWSNYIIVLTNTWKTIKPVYAPKIIFTDFTTDKWGTPFSRDLNERLIHWLRLFFNTKNIKDTMNTSLIRISYVD